MFSFRKNRKSEENASLQKSLSQNRCSTVFNEIEIEEDNRVTEKPSADILQKAIQLKKQTDLLTTSIREYTNLSMNRVSNYFQLTKVLKKIELSCNELGTQVGTSNFAQWINEEKTALEKAKSNLVYEFGRTLAEGLSKNGLTLEGNFPEFKIKTFLLQVDMETAKCNLYYGNKEEFLTSTPIVASAAEKVILKSRENITTREFDSTKFITRLFKAYENSVKKQQKAIGDEVGIISILLELNFLNQDQRFFSDPRRAIYREYPREYFSYDLFRLKQREKDNFALSLNIATREQNRSRNTYLWVPSEESLHGNVYSQISFRRKN